MEALQACGFKKDNKMRSQVPKQGESGGKWGRFRRPFSEVALLPRTAPTLEATGSSAWCECIRCGRLCSLQKAVCLATHAAGRVRN